MGQKVNPIGLRLGIGRIGEEWRSIWYARKRTFPALLQEDVSIREYLLKRFPRSSIGRIDIKKVSDRIQICIRTPRPGVVLGRKGAEINAVRDELYRMLQKQVNIDVEEINPPGRSAQFIADSIALQLEKRTPHRQVVKKAMALALQSGARGVKVQVSGRIAGAEISRSELYINGTVPLHTLRAQIDYATSTAVLKTGTVGVKVWLYLGDREGKRRADRAEQQAETQTPAPPVQTEELCL